MVKCSICGEDESSLLRVKHRKLGTIKICFDCWEVENGNKNLFPSSGCWKSEFILQEFS
jgi:hypothetical protein